MTAPTIKTASRMTMHWVDSEGCRHSRTIPKNATPEQVVSSIIQWCVLPEHLPTFGHTVLWTMAHKLGELADNMPAGVTRQKAAILVDNTYKLAALHERLADQVGEQP